MGQIIIPTDRKIKGPWLLDKIDVQELNDTLRVIEDKLQEGLDILITKTANSIVDQNKKSNENENKDIDETKKKLRESYYFNKFEKSVVILTEQGNKIKDDDLLAILKGTEINVYKPTDLKIHMQKGPCEFTLEITTKYDGELETRIKEVDDSILNDINYEINRWIDKHKPTLIMQKWSIWFPFSAIIIFLWLLIVTAVLIKDKKDIYQTQIQQESYNLLKDGLTDAETIRAIELILQKENSYVPESFDPDIKINQTLGYIWLVSSVCLIILMIKPKTTIGLGKNKWKVAFYRKWVYIVLVFIPLSIILPILRSKLT